MPKIITPLFRLPKIEMVFEYMGIKAGDRMTTKKNYLDVPAGSKIVISRFVIDAENKKNYIAIGFTMHNQIVRLIPKYLKP